MIDEHGFTHEGRTLAWDDLVEVSVVTTAAGGPLAQDALFVLLGESGSLVVSASHPSSQALLGRLQRLPGFQNEVLVTAMETAEADRFVVWTRAEPSRPA